MPSQLFDAVLLVIDVLCNVGTVEKRLVGGLWSRCMNLNKALAVSNCRNEMHFFFPLADLTERRLIYPHEELSAGSPVPLIYSPHCSAGYWPVIYCKWSRWCEMGENRALIYLFIFQLKVARQNRDLKVPRDPTF